GLGAASLGWPLLFSELTGLDNGLAPVLDPVGISGFANAHGVFQLCADKVEADAVVGGDPRRKAVRDELLVDRPAPLLAVVVRTGAAGEEAEPVAHTLELRPE